MGEMNFSDLGAILNTLKENPQMAQMLGSMLGFNGGNAQPKPSPPPENRNPSFDADTLSAFMNMLGKSSPPQKNEHERSPQSRNLSVFGSSEEIKNRIALLCAVRPYLSETRKDRLETVIKLLRLAELGGLSQILS
jgi:hypothetical protein